MDAQGNVVNSKNDQKGSGADQTGTQPAGDAQPAANPLPPRVNPAGSKTDTNQEQPAKQPAVNESFLYTMNQDADKDLNDNGRNAVYEGPQESEFDDWTVIDKPEGEQNDTGAMPVDAEQPVTRPRRNAVKGRRGSAPGRRVGSQNRYIQELFNEIDENNQEENPDGNDPENPPPLPPPSQRNNT